MRVRRIAALATLALLAVPGAAGAQERFFDVGKLPLPEISGPQIANDVEAFSETYAPRVTGTMGDATAAEFLRSEAEKLGYKAEIQYIPIVGPEPAEVARVVVATKTGRTKPDENLLFMGHYDTVAGYGGVTVEGAYDNGSGTTMILELARAFANVPTNRTLKFLWYNGEEEGLIASERHAAAETAAGTKIRAGLGFDMVGIAWPVGKPEDSSCLCIWHGDEDEAFEPLIRYINYDVLKFPEGDTEVAFAGVNARNSDESSWDGEGHPTLRWAGRRTAASYPAYHRPNDNMATIEEVAGGRNFFEQGLRNTLVSSYLTALALDNSMPQAKATASGDRTVTFDASGSSDPEGEPSTYRWDFGDGESGSGRTVTHTYARGGTYTASLTVGDNIWPQVTSAAQVPVSVKAPATAKKKKPGCKKRRAKGESKRAFKKRMAKCRKARRRGRG